MMVEKYEFIYESYSVLKELFNLDDLDLKIYVKLLESGPTTASQISKQLNIDRAKTYRVMDKLIQNNLVHTTLTSPKKCIVSDPKNVLKEIFIKKENELISLKKESNKILKKIYESSHKENSNITPNCKPVNGKEAIFSSIVTLLENASNTVYIVAPISDIAKMYHTAIPEKIYECEKNKIKVKIITETIHDISMEYIKRLNSTEIRTMSLVSRGIIVVEKDKNLITTEESTYAGKQPGIVTNFEHMIKSNYQFCEMLWEKATPLQKIIINH